MVLGRYYGAIEILRLGKVLAVHLLKPHRVLSTCRVAGGIREDLQWVCNHQACEPAGHGLAHRLWADPVAYRELICSPHGIDPERTALLGTAASMTNAAIATAEGKGLVVVAACTAGVESNATAPGDPPAVHEPEGGRFETLEQPGTIVTMLFINREVSPGALVRAAITATEAKSAVLMRLGVGSCYSPEPATGTGTDQLAIGSLLNTGRPLTGTGGHTLLGQLIAQAVSKAISRALELQNRMTPASQCSLLAVLKRLGISSQLELVELIGSYLPPFYKELLSRNHLPITHDGPTVAATTALVCLWDRLRWGLLPTECAPEILGRAAAQIAAAASAWAWEPPQLSPPTPRLPTAQELAELVGKAVAEGFQHKWPPEGDET